MTREELKAKLAELKSQIKINASTARHYRQEGRTMLAAARQLRKDGKLKEAGELTYKAVSTHESAKSINQRELLLAYGYLRGRKYKTIEQKTNLTEWQQKCLAKSAADFAEAQKDALFLWMSQDLTCYDIDPCLSEMIKLKEARQEEEKAELGFSGAQSKVLTQQREIDRLTIDG